MAKEPVGDWTRLYGKATYKSRTYFMASPPGASPDSSVRLITLNGKLDFWVKASNIQVIKLYEPRKFRGETLYQTVGSMREFIAGLPEKIKQTEQPKPQS